LLVSGQAAHAQHPAHWCRHAPDDVFAEAGGDEHIVTTVANGEQLLRPRRSFFGEVERIQIVFLDEGSVIGLQAVG
jgi:hypothetical protein